MSLLYHCQVGQSRPVVLVNKESAFLRNGICIAQYAIQSILPEASPSGYVVAPVILLVSYHYVFCLLVSLNIEVGRKRTTVAREG